MAALSFSEGELIVPETQATPKTYVLFHANCYDGWAAAFASWLKFGETATYLPVAYGNPPPALERGSDVYIVDFSYPRATMLDMANNHYSLTILDHHKTAQADLEGLEAEALQCGIMGVTAQFDMNESGATLAWDYFHAGQERPRVFEYVKDRDLWTFALPLSREINAALRSEPFDFERWQQLCQPKWLNELAVQGRGILKHQDEMVAMMCKQAVWRKLGGYNVPVVNATVYFSEVGDYLCQQHEDIPFAAYYLDRADKKRQWGLRSRGGFDCSLVAKQFGGGGHAGAAGFVTELGWLPPVAEAEEATP